MKLLTAERRKLLRTWGPALMAAGTTWLLLMTLGETPLARACGLALAIFGVTASMRPMGFVASTAGGLTLALCPVFWSQSGGGVAEPATIVIAAAVAFLAMLASAILLKRQDLGVGLGIGVFVILFWSQIGTPQSLRLTGLVSAWLLYLLVDMIMLTNPRPGIKPAKAPKAWQPLGLLLLLAVGAVNDPLVVLFAPAILLALFLSYARLPAWFWLALILTVVRRSGSARANLHPDVDAGCRHLGLAASESLDRARATYHRAIQRAGHRARRNWSGSAGALVSATGRRQRCSPTPPSSRLAWCTWAATAKSCCCRS